MWLRADNSKLTNADDFLLHYANNPTVVMKIYINKAISFGLLTLGNGGLYLNGATFCGRDANEAVVYFSKDMQSYTNIIQPEVNRMSQLPEDDMEEIETESYVKSSFMTQKLGAEKNHVHFAQQELMENEYFALMGRAPEKWWKFEQLKAKVEELRTRKNVVENIETLPTKKVEISLTPEISEDMEKLREVARGLDVPGYQSYRNIDKLRAAIEKKQAEATV